MDKENEDQKKQEVTEVQDGSLAPVSPEKVLNLVSDEALMGVYGEILTKLRDDRKQTSELVDTFSEMVINEGDSSTSSKEALVNLVKHKTDTVDKMAKIAELMTRVKLKQPYGEGKGYLNKGAGTSGNTINIYEQGGFNKKEFLDTLNKAAKKEKK